jgi:hypothetical protein
MTLLNAISPEMADMIGYVLLVRASQQGFKNALEFFSNFQELRTL